jgi:glycosyltransferase involved in cell wall biosynthesis
LHWLEKNDRLPFDRDPYQFAERKTDPDRGFRLLAPKVHRLSDCVDGQYSSPGEGEDKAGRAAAMLGIPPGRRIVIYLGLLATYQGTDVLLQAARAVLQRRDDVHFLIMGFPAVEHYRDVARQLGLAERTTFTGKIPYHEARDFLALGDIAVAPKLSATEGSGKILNYMAMGLPTVAFDTPVSREYLGGEGIYAVPGESASLAQALLEALSDEANAPNGSRRENLRQMALAGYSWDHAIEVILRAYRLVCEDHSTVL